MAIVIEQLCRSHAVPLWEGMTEASVAHQLERACVLCAGKLNGSPRGPAYADPFGSLSSTPRIFRIDSITCPNINIGTKIGTKKRIVGMRRTSPIAIPM